MDNYYYLKYDTDGDFTLMKGDIVLPSNGMIICKNKNNLILFANSLESFERMASPYLQELRDQVYYYDYGQYGGNRNFEFGKVDMVY